MIVGKFVSFAIPVLEIEEKDRIGPSSTDEAGSAGAAGVPISILSSDKSPEEGRRGHRDEDEVLFGSSSVPSVETRRSASCTMRCACSLIPWDTSATTISSTLQRSRVGGDGAEHAYSIGSVDAPGRTLDQPNCEFAYHTVRKMTPATLSLLARGTTCSDGCTRDWT